MKNNSLTNLIRLMGIYILLSTCLYAQKPDWSPFLPLVGSWVGEGGGKPGVANGGFTYTFDLDKNILTRRNFAQYPAAEGRPASRHDDLLIIYPVQQSGFSAIYFDNEGHTIQYNVSFEKDSSTFVFTSTNSAGPKFRLTNKLLSPDYMKIVFEFSPGGAAPMQTYIEAEARKTSLN
jgi:hypothetical protein